MSMRKDFLSDEKLAHSHQYSFFITSYKILQSFFDEQSQTVNRSQAYFLYSQNGKRSKRTFYDHVDWLATHGFLFYSHGSAPAYFFTTKDQLARLKYIFLTLKRDVRSSMRATETRTLLEKGHHFPTVSTFFPSSPAISDDFSSSDLMLFSRHPFHQILHNFNVSIPLDTKLLCFNNLSKINSLFVFVPHSIVNFRRYQARFSLSNPLGNWDALVSIYQKKLTIKLYEVHGLDLDIALADAFDRVFDLIRTLEQLFLPFRLNVSELSKWRFPTRLGNTYALENEFAHHPINELLQKRISFTGIKNEFFDIDDQGTKIGWDCSPRRLADGTIVREPHLEVKGPQVVEVSTFLKDNMSYMFKSKNDNRSLNTKITTLTANHISFKADIQQEVDSLTEQVGTSTDVLLETQQVVGQSLAVISSEIHKLQFITESHSQSLTHLPGIVQDLEKGLLDLMTIVLNQKTGLFGRFKTKLRRLVS